MDNLPKNDNEKKLPDPLDPEHELPAPHDMLVTDHATANSPINTHNTTQSSQHPQTKTQPASQQPQHPQSTSTTTQTELPAPPKVNQPFGNQTTPQSVIPGHAPPPFPPPPVMSPQNNKPGFSKWLVPLILFIILLLAGGAYYFKNFSEGNNTAVEPTPTPQQSQTIPPDPTENWDTYINPQGGYQLKHPPEASINELNNSVQITYRETLPSGAPDGYELFPGYYLTLTAKPLNHRTLQQMVDSELASFKAKNGITSQNENEFITKSITETKIAAYNGYLFEYTGGGIVETHSFISDMQNIYFEIITSISDPRNKNYDIVINQILSTFKFLDSTPSATPVVTGGVSRPGVTSSAPVEGVMCTMDAKLCPDGTSVGRVGPNCEFAACPGE